MNGHCSKCDKEGVPLVKMYGRGPGKYRAWCKPCEYKRVEASRQARHKERMLSDPAYAQKMRARWVAQSQRRWRRLTEDQKEAHKARKRAWWAKARAAGKDLTRKRVPREAIVRLILAQQGLCAQCAGPLGAFHTDHIVPLAAGGLHEESNFQLLCGPCNMRKSDKHGD
jgi:5-methylcytosine-specific restriction endonuclease McrA